MTTQNYSILSARCQEKNYVKLCDFLENPKIVSRETLTGCAKRTALVKKLANFFVDFFIKKIYNYYRNKKEIIKTSAKSFKKSLDIISKK